MDRKIKGVRPSSQTSIEITFTFKKERCRERLKLKPSPANLKTAERHLHAIQDAIEKGTFDYATTFPYSSNALKFSDYKGSAISSKQYLDRWLKQQKPLLKASTFEGYRKIINNILIPAFEDLPVIKISRSDIKELLTDYQASNKRLSNIQSVLRKALSDAVDDEIIEINPLHQWKFKRREIVAKGPDIDPFTILEQQAIIDNLPPGGNNFIQFAFWTGLRTSELLALEWDDIDWTTNTAKITKAFTRAAKIPEPPKTLAGIRDVKLLEPAIEALKKQKQHSFMNPCGIIFLHPRTLQPYSGDDVIRRLLWKPALKKAGVRYRNPYQTRHTYASMMLSAGEHPMWVARQMGHSDWSMISRVYGKWMPDANPEAGNKAVELFSENAGKMLANHTLNKLKQT